MNILGISAWYHDSAVALFRDGALVSAVQEERFTRRRHDAGFPEHALAWCLKDAGLTTADLDCVAFYEKPFARFDRLLTSYLALAPRGLPSFLKAMPAWLGEKLWIRSLLRDYLPGFRGELLFGEHHQCHAASSFLLSPFSEAAILTADGVGEWCTTALGRGEGSRIELSRELRFPHSLGLLYSAFTQYLGFRVNSAEYKVMGLAPLGEPRHAQLIRDHLIDVRPDGSFHLNLDYFSFATGLEMTSPRFEALLGKPTRKEGEELSFFHKDVAASIQLVTEEVLLALARTLYKETGSKNLCLAGGVALNCTANGRLLKQSGFEKMWIQPAAGDAGGAVGAAAYVAHALLNAPRGTGMKSAFLGPSFPDEQIKAYLSGLGVPFERLEGRALADRAAGLLAEGKIVGWFEGAMEFGPRSLGARSILADPRDPAIRDRVNEKVKRRESFRPFAPVVISEKAAEWFDLKGQESPFMLFAVPVLERRRAQIPAVTHMDGSARVQTLARESHPLFHDLLESFGERTGCPVLLNTSFNVRGEPIVCTPQDAFRCFMRSGLDALVMGSFVLLKEKMPADIPGEHWDQEFEGD